MDWKLEVVPIPISDVERAKHFYRESLGFTVDLDIPFGEGGRLVQLTPPGSGCSIHLNTGLAKVPAGGLEGLQLIVDDIGTAHAELAGRGVDVSPVRHMEDSAWVDGHGGPWNAFVFFSDPDGNEWVVQERPSGS